MIAEWGIEDCSFMERILICFSVGSEYAIRNPQAAIRNHHQSAIGNQH